MRRVHILGGGTLGSLFTSHLARAGVEPTLLLRPTASVRDGHCTVQVTEEGGSCESTERIRCETTDDPSGGPLDILLVATKAYDVGPALGDVRQRLSASSSVILLCNGALAVAERLAEDRLHAGPLMAATTSHGAWSRGVRDVHHAGAGESWIGPLGHAVSKPGLMSWIFEERMLAVVTTPSSAEAQQLFADHGLGAHIESAAATERRLWLKLAANAVLNPLTALWDCPNGEVLSRAEGRETARAVCEEISQVSLHLTSDALAKEGLGAHELLDFVSQCAEASARNTSSMRMDLRHGRRTEIDELNGWVARKAHELRLTSGKSCIWLGKNEALAKAIQERSAHQSHIQAQASVRVCVRAVAE